MTPEEKRELHQRVLDRMAALGWIDIHSPIGAKTAISLTPKGRESLLPLFEFLRSFDDEPFTDDVLGAFIGIAKHIRENVDGYFGDDLDLGQV